MLVSQKTLISFWQKKKKKREGSLWWEKRLEKLPLCHLLETLQKPIGILEHKNFLLPHGTIVTPSLKTQKSVELS